MIVKQTHMRGRISRTRRTDDALGTEGLFYLLVLVMLEFGALPGGGLNKARHVRVTDNARRGQL